METTNPTITQGRDEMIEGVGVVIVGDKLVLFSIQPDGRMAAWRSPTNTLIKTKRAVGWARK
jgi:hypothetical protein